MKAKGVEPKKPLETINLSDDNFIEGLSTDDVVTIKIKCRLVSEESRDWEGKKRKSQRFQIIEVMKGNERAARTQSTGRGIAL